MHTVAVIAVEGIGPFHLSVPCIVFGDDLAMLCVPRYRPVIRGENGPDSVEPGCCVATS